jgi:Copper transport outer membrane protein, MctB
VIDFRYHLVSIVAVFLALAIGLVVGATALKPRTLQVLDRESIREQHQISAQRTQIQGLKDQIVGEQAAAKANAPLVLGNLLEGQRVVLVIAPGADGSTVSGVTHALQQAGAKVTAQADLLPAFFDTSASTESNLDALAQQVAPPGVTPGIQPAQPDISAQIAGQHQAAQVLAPALVTKDGADLPAQPTQKILAGFAAQGYLKMNVVGGSAALAQATLAVVVIPAAAPASGDTDPANLALLSVAEQLSLSSRGVVLAGSLSGSGSGSGSAIDELIHGSTGIKLSSVDSANTEVGQIEVAQALSLLLNRHAPASYSGLSDAAPSPAPTPAATPTPTRSPVKNKSSG